MTDTAAILIADDERSFRESTARLLRQAGYECGCAEDTEKAIETLRSRHFDVLIADIRMPHNPDMRIVREARQLDREMAIIIATGYPSTETAIQSVGLPVVAYLTKPLDFDDLLKQVQLALVASHRRRAITAIVERLQTCLNDLESIKSRPNVLQGEIEEISTGTIRTLATCLSELLTLSTETGHKWGWRNLCQLLECPQEVVCREAILDAIEVLEETKKLFKSKPLALLRGRLESVVGKQ